MALTSLASRAKDPEEVSICDIGRPWNISPRTASSRCRRLYGNFSAFTVLSCGKTCFRDLDFILPVVVFWSNFGSGFHGSHLIK